MRFRKPLWVIPWLLVALTALHAVEIDAERYLGHIKYLASEELKGRGAGTPELEKAADYIAEQFRAIGLRPPKGNSYFQPFDVTINARLGPNNRIEYRDGRGVTRLKPEQDFRPLSFSARGRISGRLVFAGYGITAPEYGYDDYAGLDVENRIVVVLRHEPQEFDDDSVFGGRTYTNHAQLESKALNARFRGARGVILVNDTMNHPGDGDSLEEFSQLVAPASPGIPFVQVKASVVREWIARAGKDLEEIAAAIDKDLQPRSFAFPDSFRINLTVDVRREVRTIRNVAGYLPGETAEHVIIGAHYDHLGLGEQFSMAPSLVGTPHHGADDNASGTAGVIELARWFASQPKPRRGLLFLAFTGEEIGLLGSNHYVNHPLLPLEDAVAMINMDMIGRVRDGKVYVGGVGTGVGFREMFENLDGESGLTFELSDAGGYGSSDHYSFTPKQIPVLFFFSGLHGDYHRPSDTWDRIDAPTTARLLQYVGQVTRTLLDAPKRPEFIRLADPIPAHTASGGGGYGPYFGSVPDFSQTQGGVRFADVRDRSPAATAKLRAGDILIEFDGRTIENLYDFTYALRSKKAGDEVEVKVRRNGHVVQSRVVLGERK